MAQRKRSGKTQIMAGDGAPKLAASRPRGIGERARYDRRRNLWVDGAYWFDEKSAESAVDFFPRHLRLTTGEWAGRPFVLEAWEADYIIRPLFGWKRADGTRRYRRCYVWIPRKNGKTELAAGIGLLLLVGDAEFGAEVYAIASARDQAAIVFSKAAAMVQLSPSLQEHLSTLKTTIFCPSTSGNFRPLTGRATGKHGLNMSGLVGDEVHEWPSGDLYQFMHDSSSARSQPLEFMISTAGQRGGYGEEVYAECEKIVEGVIDDPETLVVIFVAPEHADWRDERTWYMANPNLGVSKKLDAMRADARRAMQLPRLENAFKSYHLNIWSEQAQRWLPIDNFDDNGRKFGWKYCAGQYSWQELQSVLIGKTCFAGVDLSSTADLSAVVLFFPEQFGLEAPAILSWFYKPEAYIRAHGERDRLPYAAWRNMGALTATPGNVVDYDFIRSDLVRNCERYDIRRIGCDPFNATQFMINLADDLGDAKRAREERRVVKYRQGFLSMSPPSKELERLVIDNRIQHGNHPILTRHATVVAVETDPAGNIKPSKKHTIERIDGIAALVTAMGVSTTLEPERPRITSEDIIERGGLMVIG